MHKVDNMKPFIETPNKIVEQNDLRRVDSEQAIIPITMKDELANRLKDNVKIIEMINHSRFQRSKERRKDQLYGEIEQRESTSKKKVVNEIITKLDSALKQSRSSMQNSRRCHSQTKQMEEKIKAFENILKQVKESNKETHHQLNWIKNQVDTEANTKSAVDYEKPKRTSKYNVYVYSPHETRYSIHKAVIEQKNQYVYPKYVKPQTLRRRSPNVCIQAGCRVYCKCQK